MNNQHIVDIIESRNSSPFPSWNALRTSVGAAEAHIRDQAVRSRPCYKAQVPAKLQGTAVPIQREFGCDLKGDPDPVTTQRLDSESMWGEEPDYVQMWRYYTVHTAVWGLFWAGHLVGIQDTSLESELIHWSPGQMNKVDWSWECREGGCEMKVWSEEKMKKPQKLEDGLELWWKSTLYTLKSELPYFVPIITIVRRRHQNIPYMRRAQIERRRICKFCSCSGWPRPSQNHGIARTAWMGPGFNGLASDQHSNHCIA